MSRIKHGWNRSSRVLHTIFHNNINIGISFKSHNNVRITNLSTVSSLVLPSCPPITYRQLLSEARAAPLRALFIAVICGVSL